MISCGDDNNNIKQLDEVKSKLNLLVSPKKETIGNESEN